MKIIMTLEGNPPEGFDQEQLREWAEDAAADVAEDASSIYGPFEPTVTYDFTETAHDD